MALSAFKMRISEMKTKQGSIWISQLRLTRLQQSATRTELRTMMLYARGLRLLPVIPTLLWIVVTYAIGGWPCANPLPSLVDDMHICTQDFPIDGEGKVLGYAGPLTTLLDDKTDFPTVLTGFMVWAFQCSSDFHVCHMNGTTSNICDDNYNLVWQVRYSGHSPSHTW